MATGNESVIIEGTIDDIVYKNEATGYTVCSVDVNGQLVVMVGIMPMLMAGEGIKAVGRWSLHSTFGEQFCVEQYDKTMPSTANAISLFLAGGFVKGIGPKTAAAMVELFGGNTINIIETQPQRLTEVKGITKAKANEISFTLKEHYSMRTAIDYFISFDISAYEAVAIYKELGNDCLSKIKDNPYIICEEPILIDFETAEKIATEQLGTEGYSDYRIEAAIKHILRHNQKNGHTFIPRDTLCTVAAELVCAPADDIGLALENLLMRAQVICSDISGYDAIYLPNLFFGELYIAQKLCALDRYPKEDLYSEDKIEKIEEKLDIQYDVVQKRAISEALKRGVFVLTGGPGTGKTTIINAIIKIFFAEGKKVLLAAPTGRAAKRMTEVCAYESKTIHRLLEMGYTRDNIPHFQRNEKNMLKADCIIVDECSMIDVPLMEALLRATPDNCRLVLVGDADQLPSIGPGNVLGDIIKSGCISCVELKEIFRQSRESLIIVNAHQINHGEYPELSSRGNDFFFLPCNGDSDIAPLLVSLCRDRLPKAYKISGINDVQVITPTRKTQAGTIYLNRVLQDTLNPPKKGKEEMGLRDGILRIGDKVMQIRNNYSIEWEKGNEKGLGVFNGDVGVIVAIDKRIGMIKVSYDERIVTYDAQELDQIELAYAVTVHKSQGSEFSIVIFVCKDAGPSLCNRNLIYTAVTRAKDILIAVGSEQAVYKMVDNTRKNKRYCSLQAMIMGECREG